MSNPGRGGKTFGYSFLGYRLLFYVTWFMLCRFTPRSLRLIRILVLKSFGAKIGTNCNVSSSARIWAPCNLEMRDWVNVGPGVRVYNVAKVLLDDGVLLSQDAYLCTASHNFRVSSFDLKSASIVVGKKAWICTEAFIGPGVFVGEGAVLGARSVAFRNLEEWSVYTGNPSKKISDRPRVDYMHA